METKDFLKRLSEEVGVSGYESRPAEVVKEGFAGLVDDIRQDKLGNVIMLKRGDGAPETPRPKVMLAAHMDEIGLMVSKIEKDGMVRITTVGGIDPRIMPASEVVIHGKRDVPGVIGAKPPHLQSPEERKSAHKLHELFIDTGLPREELISLVSVGDTVTFTRSFVELGGDIVAGKSLDDRAGVAVMLECAKELKRLRHTADVYFVATVQEEVGVRGAYTSTYGITPDVGIAIDVGHGDIPGVPEHWTIELGKGPGIGFGPHVNPKVFERLKKVAEDYNIQFQVEPSTSPGGTDAFAIQVTRAGVPTALISIPLRYMHTTVETMSMGDVVKAGRILALFIASVDFQYVEGLRCF